MFFLDDSGRPENFERVQQPLIHSQPWDDIWNRGFLPQFSDEDLSRLTRQLAEVECGVFMPEVIRNFFETCNLEANRRVNSHTMSWRFFGWYDDLSWTVKVRPKLIELIATEINRRAADGQAKEVDRGQEEGQEGS